MDFNSVMETFAEAWVAANTHTPLTEAAEQVDFILYSFDEYLRFFFLSESPFHRLF